ncbi:glycosyltransferase [bacterium]|nr:glycosyltransferase [bacterium]
MQDPSTSASFKLSIVIPMYNEEQGARECVRRVKAVLNSMGCDHEIIFVNDGSVDKTLEYLIDEKSRDEKLRIVDLSRNFGHQAAITAGLDRATGDCVIVIDGDLQDPPEVFPRLVEKWQEGYDVVHARRIKRKGMSFLAHLRAKVYYRIMRAISEIDIPVDVGDFRLISKRVCDNLRQLREKHRYIRGLATWVGYKQTIIEYDREERFAGVPQYTFAKLVHLSMAGLTGFSKFPLRLGVLLGAFCFALCLIFASILMLWPAATASWTPAVIAILFVGALQLVCLGIIGEYLALGLEHHRNRPLYIVQEEY